MASVDPLRALMLPAVRPEQTGRLELAAELGDVLP